MYFTYIIMNNSGFDTRIINAYVARIYHHKDLHNKNSVKYQKIVINQRSNNMNAIFYFKPRNNLLNTFFKNIDDDDECVHHVKIHDSKKCLEENTYSISFSKQINGTDIVATYTTSPYKFSESRTFDAEEYASMKTQLLTTGPKPTFSTYRV